MSKRVAVNLDDFTHEQVTERAAEAGMSAHAWLVAAIEREAFRQLCEKQARWNAEHPELVAAARAEFDDDEQWLAEREAGRDSSAA